MSRKEGFYWVRERGEGALIIAAFRDGQWTFGDGDELADESNLDVVGDPLTPPTPQQAAGWKARYDQIIQVRKAAGEKDPTGGWDWLDGYYWVRVDGEPEPVLAQYMEGWGDAAGDQEFDEVEIIDGPLIPPQVAKRQVA